MSIGWGSWSRRGACSLLLVAAVATPRLAWSNTEAGTIRGEVRDSVSGDVLQGIQVQLDDQTAITDSLGQFSIRKGAPPYRVALSRPSQKAVIRTVSEVESLSTVILTLDALVKREERIDVFGVLKDDPAPSSIPLRPQQVLQVAGAVDNIFRALQTLPGVAATEEFGSRLSVRGGTPDQNLRIMDGVALTCRTE